MEWDETMSGKLHIRVPQWKQSPEALLHSFAQLQVVHVLGKEIFQFHAHSLLQIPKYHGRNLHFNEFQGEVSHQACFGKVSSAAGHTPCPPGPWHNHIHHNNPSSLGQGPTWDEFRKLQTIPCLLCLCSHLARPQSGPAQKPHPPRLMQSRVN